MELKHLLIIGALALTVLASCSRGGSNAVSSSLDGMSGELTIMMWAGDDRYYPNLGGQNLSSDELLAFNVGAAYATIKAFNKIHPNVRINFYAKSGDPNENGLWDQHRENFRMEYGVYPDMWATQDMVGDMQKGLIADLSIFKDEPMYKMFNPSIMELMNLEGRQFGLPQYIIPWGIFINKSLAESLNIDIPDPDWTIDEFTRFVSHSRPNEYYGMMGEYYSEIKLVETGSYDYAYMILNHKPGEPYVNINSQATRNLLRYFSQWAANAIWPNWDRGNVSQEMMDENWWWAYKFFYEGKLLTMPGDPWQMGDAADPTGWGTMRAPDWDIYPRPSTEYMENHIGIVLDPFVIKNFAMDDGNPELSPQEEAKLRLAWEFASFWCGDTRAIKARADQLFVSEGAYKSCLNDSFPLVTGAEFDRQMEIWFTTEPHKRFADKEKMPGFQLILKLWAEGKILDIADKTYPRYYDFEGSRRSIFDEWFNGWNAEVVGADRNDPNWLDNMYARLPQWNNQLNQRLESEWANLNVIMDRYYPKR